MNSSLPLSQHIVRFFSLLTCCTSLFLTQVPSIAIADDWEDFQRNLTSTANNISITAVDGFNKLYSNYQDAITKPNQHDGSSQDAQKAEEAATLSGWACMTQLLQATTRKEYSYSDFQTIVMDFFYKVYSKVPASYQTTTDQQVPNGIGGSTPQGDTMDNTDSNPRYYFGGTTSTIPLNSDCSVNVNAESSIAELGLSLRYQTLSVIFTAIIQDFFSPSTLNYKETIKLLEGNKTDITNTPEAQAFQTSVLPYLQMVAQDPFSPVCANFAKTIMCAALNAGILAPGSVDVDCKAKFEGEAGCSRPDIYSQTTL